MNEFWKLDNLYKGFDDPCFDADMTALKEKVAEAADLAGRLDTYAPVDGLRRGIELEEQVQCLVMKLAEYAQLRQSANTRDGEAGSMMGRIMAIRSGMAAPSAAFNAWVVQLPNLMDLVRGDEYPKDYEFYFAGKVDSAKYQMGGEALEEAGFKDAEGNWTELANSYGIYSKEDFLNCPEGQDYAIAAYHKVVCRYIRAYDLEQYIGKSYCGVKVTRSGLLAGCHLVGIGSMKKALASGEPSYDGYGTPASEYLELFGGYNIRKVWKE